jgi:hypothetical protein
LLKFRTMYMGLYILRLKRVKKMTKSKNTVDTSQKRLSKTNRNTY